MKNNKYDFWAHALNRLVYVLPDNGISSFALKIVWDTGHI